MQEDAVSPFSRTEWFGSDCPIPIGGMHDFESPRSTQIETHGFCETQNAILRTSRFPITLARALLVP